jgi:hypothetical protein
LQKALLAILREAERGWKQRKWTRERAVERSAEGIE